MSIPLAARGAVLLVAVALGMPAVAAAQAPATPAALASPATTPDASQLWAFVGRRAAELDSAWSPALGAYVTKGSSLVSSRLNANMLLVHSTAALAGGSGPERNDARIPKIVDVLTQYPAYIQSARGLSDDQAHTPGWASDAGHFPSDQHVSLDPQVADGLAAAWQARVIARLSTRQVADIQREIGAVAWSSFYRFPHTELNQFNWAADLYQDDLIVNGRPRLLQHDYQRRLTDFLDHARTPARPGWSPNLNAGLGFHYLNTRPLRFPMNQISTSEYGNIVFNGLSHLDAARAVGMRIGAHRAAILHAWAERLLDGEWTHAGYLNWDTGHNWDRWHLTRYWVLALAGLSTLGEAPILSQTEREWARWMFGQSLRLYERYQTDERRPDMPATLFGVHSTQARDVSDPQFIAARIGALVAESAAARADETPAREPPALYAYDPDIHRLAITTPAYSTAVVDQDFVTGYGGADLARLYDGAGRPLGSIGSVRTHGFDLRVTTAGNDFLLDTQRGGRTAASMHLAGGRGLRGTFTRVGLDGLIGGRLGSRVRFQHRFTPTDIERDYEIRAPRGSLARVRLPIWSRFEAAQQPTVQTIPGGVRVHVRQSAGGYTAEVRARGPLAVVFRRLTPNAPTTPGTTGLLEVVAPITTGLGRVRVTIEPDPV